MDSVDDIARQCLRPIRGAVTDEQWIDVLERVKRAIEVFRHGLPARVRSITATRHVHRKAEAGEAGGA